MAESLSALALTIWNMRSSLSWFAALCLEIRSVSSFSFFDSFLISLNFFLTSFCPSFIRFCPSLISTILDVIPLIVQLRLRIPLLVTFILCLQCWSKSWMIETMFTNLIRQYVCVCVCVCKGRKKPITYRPVN